jgi:hypothetical protein
LPSYVCVSSSGVAYRNSPEWRDRVDDSVAFNETVQVLEHWIKTPNGWLPVEELHTGAVLFKRLRQDSGDGNGRPHRGSDLSPPRQQQVRMAPDGYEVQKARRDSKTLAAEATVPVAPAVAQGAPSRSLRRDSSDGGLRRDSNRKPPPETATDAPEPAAESCPAEWQGLFDRLSERFPTASARQVLSALKNNDGHAGKAASQLRNEVD